MQHWQKIQYPMPIYSGKAVIATPNPKLKKGQVNDTTNKRLERSIPRVIPASRSVDLNAFSSKIYGKDRLAR